MYLAQRRHAGEIVEFGKLPIKTPPAIAKTAYTREMFRYFFMRLPPFLWRIDYSTIRFGDAILLRRKALFFA